MKWLNFFIDRPVTAGVINIMLIVCGLLAFRTLLLDEYPRIIVPKVKVHTRYRNASAETVEKEITTPIEEALSFVEGVESISSSSKSGSSDVRLVFSPHVSMDRAIMQVSEQLSRIAANLPTEAESPEIKRGDEEGGGFIYLGVRSKTLSGSYLTHFAKTHIQSHFQGIEGVSEVEVMGPPLAMSVVLDTLAMHSLRIGPHDIIRVLKQNERLLQAGRTRSSEPINLDVVAKDAEDYRRLIVGMNGDVPVFLGDVARVDFATDNLERKIRIDGQNAIIIGVSKAPDGNNIDVASAIHAMVDKVNIELRGQAVVNVESDHSVFVRASLSAIFRTIFEACVLVIFIIFFFLRHLRATLVPLVTIPISLVATFFALQIFGLSINTITLLAMVLAVGLVVDDAIVVLENIFRFREQGYSAMEAARKGAAEIGFAIIAMTFTLVSVFLPLAFVTDITGTLLREFAITLASAVMFSGIVALTLSPLMAAHLLRHQPKDGRIGKAIDRGIRATEELYQRLLRKTFDRRAYVFASMLLFLGLGVFLNSRLQSNLLPNEDRGIIGAFIPMVPGFDLDEMEPYAAQVEQIFLQQEGIARTIVMGFKDGMQVVSVLKPWAERKNSAEKIVSAIREQVATIPTAAVYPWSWDIGLDALQDDSHERADVVVALKSVGSYEDLDAIAQKLAQRIREDNILEDARSDLDMNEKSYSIKVQRAALAALGVDEKTVSMALQTYADRVLASEFRFDGQRYHIYMEPDVVTEDLNAVYVRTKSGESVPLSTIAHVKQEVQAPVLKHLNSMRTANVLASLGEGQSMGDAKEYLDRVIKEEVPADVAVSFEGAMGMQRKSTQTFILLFFAGLVFIFAVMAIQFEGILDPLIILVTVPFACLGGVLILWMTNTGTNLYTQVGMLTLIGLITKHGILLTEFVGQKRCEMQLKDAVFLAAQLRFRPIVMTTAATVLGALPLVLSRGAGVEARAAIGLVIVGGMIFGTILTLFVLPSAIYTAHDAKLRWQRPKTEANNA